MGRVYVIDDATGTRAWITYRVFVDGSQVCDLRGGRYTVFDVAPGKHRFLLLDLPPQDLEIPAARSTYIRLFVPPKKDAYLTVIDEAQAQSMMASLHRVEARIGTGVGE
jgi:hypothetical protein